MRGEGGFALVMTLIVTALLVALSAEFAGEVYVDTSSRQNFVDGQQASVLADSGVFFAIKYLQQVTGGQTYTSLNDDWAKPYKLEDETGALAITIEDESGKLNLNKVAQPNNGDPADPYYGIFARLLKKQGLPPELFDTLADWIDQDDVPHPAGAETPYYATLKPPYPAKNGLLETLEEIRLVKGYDAKTLDKLRPFVTVYAGDANPIAAVPVNINTAPVEVLVALDDGMSKELADRIVAYRKGTPFKMPQELAKVAGMETIAPKLSGYIGVKGTVFRIRSEGQVKETRRIAEAVVRLDVLQSNVLYWREY